MCKFKCGGLKIIKIPVCQWKESYSVVNRKKNKG